MVYSRTELAIDKIKKLEKAEEALASIESFQKQYMKQ
jgi:hypothetical protein